MRLRLAYSGLFWLILAYSGLFWLKDITESRVNNGWMKKMTPPTTPLQESARLEHLSSGGNLLLSG